ncbi:ribonuclease H-like domain-containing protein [Dipodascopsis uninucleata]
MQLSEGPLVWIDCEMTGLDLETDQLMEVACFVTDGDLNLIEPDGFEMVIHCSQAKLEAMNEWCKSHHRESGLSEKCLKSQYTAQTVEKKLLEYLQSAGVKKSRTALLAGNSVHADKDFLRKEMPKFLEFLHYRIIDVSTVKELARRRNPKVFRNAPAKRAAHTAKSDILESIAELRYYYDTWLLPD